jgi:ATPase subunit of ABC transporter with duplicated ATPase domains
MAVTHDRYFLNDVAGWICEVDRGQLYPYEGNYSTYLEKKAARLEAESRENAKRAKKMRSELEWVRQSPKARQAKNRARLERYEQMEAEARATKKLDFSEIQIPVGPRLGAKVLTVEHLTKAFGDRVLIDDLSFDLPPQRHRGRDWPQRRGQDHALQDDRWPGAALLGHAGAGRDGQALLRGPDARRHRPQEERLGGRL